MRLEVQMDLDLLVVKAAPVLASMLALP